MNKNIYLYSGIIGVFTSAICAFFDYRIALGVILGILSSFLYFYLLNNQFEIVDGQIKKGGALGFIVRIMILAFPLLISCLLPNIFNIFGAFGGVMLFRIIMMFTFFKQKGGK